MWLIGREGIDQQKKERETSRSSNLNCVNQLLRMKNLILLEFGICSLEFYSAARAPMTRENVLIRS